MAIKLRKNKEQNPNQAGEAAALRPSKGRAYTAWLAFVLGLTILVVYAAMGVAALSELPRAVAQVPTLLRGDYLDSARTGYYFSELLVKDALGLAAETTNFAERAAVINADMQSDNALVYFYTENVKTGNRYQNRPAGFGIYQNGSFKMPSGGLEKVFSDNKHLVIPDGYQVIYYWNGTELRGEPRMVQFCEQHRSDILPIGLQVKQPAFEMETASVTVTDLPIQDDAGLVSFSQPALQMPAAEALEMADSRVIIAVKQDLTLQDFSTHDGNLYNSVYNANRYMYLVWGLIGVAIFGVLLLLFACFNWRYKRQASQRIAELTGQLWLEPKLIVTAVTAAVLIKFLFDQFALGALVTGVFGLWQLLLLINELAYNGLKALVGHNFFHSLTCSYRALEARQPFIRAMMLRLIAVIGCEAILVTSAVICGVGGAAPLMLLAVAAGVLILAFYFRLYRRQAMDLAAVVTHIEAMGAGQAEGNLVLPTDSDLRATAENLNKLSEGISRAVEESMRSERLKIDLITNVSHDLKTPLTSIIGYVDLLAAEEDLPPHVQDYIRVLSQKSQRLKVMMQDIFDVSKATSGNLDLHRERLDFAKLVRQTLAEMDEEITAQQANFKLLIPEVPVYIQADGDKIYRVIQNLLVNALRYSLPETRIFVELLCEQGRAVLTCKNVAKYEMKFEGEQIVERFARGDSSRNSDGSGLGLAIAKSFTEACGGALEISVNGDLFIARVSFDLKQEIQSENANN